MGPLNAPLRSVFWNILGIFLTYTDWKQHQNGLYAIKFHPWRYFKSLNIYLFFIINFPLGAFRGPIFKNLKKEFQEEFQPIKMKYNVVYYIENPF